MQVNIGRRHADLSSRRPQAPPTPADPVCDMKTALVVDDSASMRQMLSFTLTKAGYEVVQSANGREGLLALAGNRAIDLVITDLNMPVMDGIEFIKQLRTRPNHKFTPVLMLTTEAAQDRKMEGKAAGATGWLVKPFDPDKLLAILAKVR
jgi:two-component system chemotaxis response regulator CheY